MCNFAPAFAIAEAGGSPNPGLRVPYRLGNADNGGNAGSCYLNGNNAVGAAYANYGLVLSLYSWSEPLPMEEHIER